MINSGGIYLTSINGGYGFTVVDPNRKEVDWNIRISVRDNLALLKRGQQLVNLKFKGNRSIPNSVIRFTEDGNFELDINGVVMTESKSLKEITDYLVYIMVK